MKGVGRSLTILAVVVSVAADSYDSRYDNFDITPLVENDRVLLNYSKCFLDKGPCTAEGRDFKKIIPEALQTTCQKCTPKQKVLIKEVIKALRERHPDVWDTLIHKYDKDGRYKESFEKFMNE